MSLQAAVDFPQLHIEYSIDYTVVQFSFLLTAIARKHPIKTLRWHTSPHLHNCTQTQCHTSHTVACVHNNTVGL